MEASLENVERDCDGIEEHFNSTLVLCTCGGEGRGCCCETRFGIFLRSSGNEWTKPVGAERERFVTHVKKGDLNGEEREGRSMVNVDDWTG